MSNIDPVIKTLYKVNYGKHYLIVGSTIIKKTN